MRDSSLDTWDARHVPILNRRDVPPRDTQVDFDPPRPVTATIRWQMGPETITTRAIAWCGRVVLVELVDARSQVRGVWLDLEDVIPLGS